MAAADRLSCLRRLLAHGRERAGIDLGFVLWHGSTVPDALAPDALAITIADEGAVAALIRRPTIDTLANLYASARVDLRGGTLFDLVAHRPKVRSREVRRSLDKKLLVGTIAKFLF